jgi:hypothetical protein
MAAMQGDDVMVGYFSAVAVYILIQLQGY